jgi:hypothetical protein
MATVNPFNTLAILTVYSYGVIPSVRKYENNYIFCHSFFAY